MAPVYPNDLRVYAGGKALAKYGVLVRRTAPWEEAPLTLTRATVGYSVNRSGVVVPAAAGVARIEWLDLDDDGARDTPAYLPEPERTNIITRSEEFDHGDWANWNQAVVVADQATAPDGATTADEVGKNNSSSNRSGRTQTQTVPDDTLSRAGSVFVHEDTAEQAYLDLRYEGGTGLAAEVKFTFATETLVDGSTDGSLAGAADDFGFEGIGGGWYRLWLTLANNGTGNTTARLTVTAQSDSSPGAAASVFAWGAQLEEGPAPSSYIATTAAAVTRNADEFSIPLNLAPGDAPFTVYHHFQARRPTEASTGEPLAALRSGDLTVAKAAGGLPSWGYGDDVKLRTVLDASGGVTLGVSVNGGAESSVGPTGVVSPTLWSTQALRLGLVGTEEPVPQAHIATLVALGDHTLEEMEAVL